MCSARSFALLVSVFAGAAIAAGAEQPVPQGTLSGKVVDPLKKPVAGARVSIHKPKFNRETGDEHTVTLSETMTDATGSFKLGPLEAAYLPGYDLRIEADGFAPQYVNERAYSIFPDRDYDLGTIGVYPGYVVTGQVIDVDGKARAGATIEWDVYRNILGHTVLQIEPSPSITTDEDGRFRTPRLPVGKLVFSVQVPQRLMAGGRIFTKPDGEETLAEPIRLERDVPVVGMVQDEDGRPIEGAAIHTLSVQRAISDKGGRFTMSGHRRDTHFQMRGHKPGYASVDRVVRRTSQGYTWFDVDRRDRKKPSEPTEDLVVVMHRSGRIEGIATDDQTGEPVQLNRVVLCTFTRKPNGEIVLAGCRDSSFEQPRPGHFRVAYGHPDEYHLTLIAEGYHDGEAFTPRVTKLQPIDGLEVKLKRKAKGSRPQIQKQIITGTVTRDGKPVRLGWVGLWKVRRSGNLVNAPILRGRTTASPAARLASAMIRDGAYSLEVPYQGSDWFVVAEEPSHALTQLGPLTIKANEEKTLDIACIEGGSILGEVKNVADGWQGQLWAIAFNATGVRAETRAGADGTFTFEQLPPGRYGLKVGHDAYTDSEMPRQDIHADAFSRLSEPWSRAVAVTVESGGTVRGVELELPEE
jgi:Carboxypeptidase regulatory-like domain